MKIKTLVAMLFLSAGATTVVAQDATNCNSNSSISHEAVRAGNFKDAYTPWKAVLPLPTSSRSCLFLSWLFAPAYTKVTVFVSLLFLPPTLLF